MANFTNAVGSFVPSRAGNTYIWSGMSRWNRSDSMKSTSCFAAFSCAVPFMMPTNSICRKHVSSSAPVGGWLGSGWAFTTSAGGLLAYDTTSG